jgi:hypothetical protein
MKACRKKYRPAAIGEAMACGPGLNSAKRSGGNVEEAAPRGSGSVMMAVEAMVMAEMPVVVTVMMAVVVMAHPGIGVEHARLHIHSPDPCAMRGPARAVSHRRRHYKHGSRKQRGGNCLQHGRVPPEIARWPVGWPGSSIMGLNLIAAR